MMNDKGLMRNGDEAVIATLELPLRVGALFGIMEVARYWLKGCSLA